jgi:O-antigen/teichoic acid export membrane protein
MISSFEALKNNFLKNKILVENFTFLSVLQVSNLVLFIITIPYLFRVLGSKAYGLVVFAQSIVYFFSIFINFGFNLTATRDISVFRDDKSKIAEIVSTVLTIKMMFFLVSLIFMTLFTFAIPPLRENRLLFMFSMLAGLSEALYPVWYFQGIEKMKYITFINVTTRILATVLIFVIITRPSDYVIFPLILGIGTVTGAVIALIVVFRRHLVRFRLQTMSTLKSYFYDNVLYFLSNVSTQIYVNANKIIVGAFLGMVEVAYYDVAEKVINILKVPYSLLGQTLFPKVSRDKNIQFINRIMVYTVIFTLILISIVFLFSDPLIHLLSGSDNQGSVRLLRILSLSLLPISVSLFYGDLLLVNFGLVKEYSKMRFFGMIVYFVLFLLIYLSNNLRAIQIAEIVVIVELFMTFYSFFLSKKVQMPPLKTI